MTNLTTDRDALYAAILANPDDDAPRLVFADYLEENGEPERAEFIRTQIAIEPLDEHDDGFSALSQRLHKLLSKYERKLGWTPKPPKGIEFEWLRRGFVESINSTIPLFLQQAATLYRTLPITTLEVTNNIIQAADTETLAASELLAPLRSLRLRNSDLTDETFAPLAASPHTRRIHTLELWGNGRLTAATVGRLMKSPTWSGLRHLQLSFVPLGDAGLHALATSPRLRQLETLELASCNGRDAGVQELLASRHLGALTKLDLDSNNLGSKTVRMLAKCERLASLKTLRLQYNKIGITGLEALGTSPHLANLRHLSVSQIRYIDKPTSTFRQPWRLTQLRSLILGTHVIGDEAAQALFGQHEFPELRSLWLTQNDLANETLIALANNPSLTKLRELNLCYNQITSKGAIALAASPLCRQFEWLHLGCNRIDDKGAQAFLESPHMSKAKRLTLFDNRISKAMQRKLKEKFKRRIDLDD